jgi:ABC-type branched-subunit amino acid transport system ATPase component
MPILSTEKVTKRFGSLVATDRVDLEVTEGSLTAIIGPNGAGKTTFFNLLTGLLPVDGGRILFDGKEITGLPPFARVKLGISRAFQVVNVFKELSVFENMAIAVQAGRPYGRDLFTDVRSLEDVNKRSEVILERMGLTRKKESLAGHLSHGEMKILDIGLALASSPKLILLDEPTSGLSPAESQEMTKLIKELATSLTVILIEHDMDIVLNIAQTITVLQQGAVIARGTPEEIRRNERVQQAYLGGVV